MGFIKKYYREILVALGIIALFFLLRLPSLLQLPIFTDEAIYLRWAQIAKNDANWRFISLTDGKQPLFIWLMMLSMKFFSDPLVAGRIVSVFAGFGTMIGLYFLGRETFKNKWIGIVAALLYALYPFALVYDRMALYDSLVGTFSVWGLYLTILLVRKMRLDIALLMGFVTGAAVLNKSNGFFTIYLLPFALILFNLKDKLLKHKLLRFIGLAAVITFLTYGFYSILRLSPFFYIINEKNAIFVYPFREWLQHPLTYFLSNISALGDWYLRYVGLPISLVVIASIIVKKSYTREKLLFLLWFFLPFIALALMGKTIYPRYIFFMTLSLLPLASYTLVALYHQLSKVFFGIVITLTLFYWIVSSYLILTNFNLAPIPRSEKGQLIAGWPSGVGVKEAVTFFEQQAEKKPIFIATEGTFGLLPYAFEVYLASNPNVTIKGYWPIKDTMPDELLDNAKKEDTYVVFYQECPSCKSIGIAPESWPLQKILQVEKLEKGSFFTVYKVIPQ